MLKFSANIGMLFNEIPFVDRFQACRKAGFQFVEFPFPYAFAPDYLNKLIQKEKLELVLFDLPVDDWLNGGRGCACNPMAVQEFNAGLGKAMVYAKALKPKLLTCIVGRRMIDIPYLKQRDTLIVNLQNAADSVSQIGVELLIEVLNDKDNPDFFLSLVSDAIDFIKAANRKNLWVQIDTYHSQKMEGNIHSIIDNNIDFVRHIQIGDVPGRHQPGTGEIDFDFLFNELEKLGYQKFIGLEYIPLGGTMQSLTWLFNYYDRKRVGK